MKIPIASPTENNQLEKLVESIKKQKFDRNIVANLSCYYHDRLIVWNEDDQCLYECSLDDRYNITDIQVSLNFEYSFLFFSCLSTTNQSIGVFVIFTTKFIHI